MQYPHCEAAGMTDVGRRRKNNEDAVLSMPDYGVFCVADGMGGAEDGEVASRAVVDTLEKRFSEFPLDVPETHGGSAKRSVAVAAINEASSFIHKRAVARGQKGSGSTVVVLILDAAHPDRAHLLHAGDSRAYRLRSGMLQQLTRDHSMAEEAGVEDEKDLPPMMRGIITRAVGVKPEVKLERTATDVKPHDLFLLCSDGLTKMIKDKRLRSLLCEMEGCSAQEIAQRLIDEANLAGGVDNVSVVLVRVGAELPDPLAGADRGEPDTETGETVEPTGLTEEEETDPGREEVTPTTGDTPMEGVDFSEPEKRVDIYSTVRGWVLEHRTGVYGVLGAVALLGIFLVVRSQIPKAPDVDMDIQADVMPVRVLLDEGERDLTGSPVVVLVRDRYEGGAFSRLEPKGGEFPSGEYEVRFERADHLVKERVVRLEGDEMRLSIPELTPGAALKQVLEAQAAADAGDHARLQQIVERDLNGVLQFEGYREQWRTLTAMAERTATTTVEEGDPTIQMEMLHGELAKLGAETARVRERDGEKREAGLERAVEQVAQFYERYAGETAFAHEPVRAVWRQVMQEIEGMIGELIEQRDPVERRARRLARAGALIEQAGFLPDEKMSVLRARLERERGVYHVRIENRTGVELTVDLPDGRQGRLAAGAGGGWDLEVLVEGREQRIVLGGPDGYRPEPSEIVVGSERGGGGRHEIDSVRLVLTRLIRSEMDIGDGHPPVEVRRFDAERGEWVALGAEIDPGRHRFRFARADYDPVQREEEVAPGIRIFTLNDPGEWRAGPALEMLKELERKVNLNEMESVKELIAELDEGSLQWPAHRERLDKVRMALVAHQELLARATEAIQDQEFLYTVEPFIRYVLRNRLTQFLRDFPTGHPDRLQEDALWELDDEGIGLEERMGAVVAFYEALYQRITSRVGRQARSSVVARLRNWGHEDDARMLMDLCAQLDQIPVEAGDDFRQWLIERDGHRLIEKIVSLVQGNG